MGSNYNTLEKINFLTKLPEDVVIPLRQHKGAPCKPLVSVGDTVLAGQQIGEAVGPGSAPVHASVSGTVAAIDDLPHPSGNKVLSIVITVDEQQYSVGFNPMENPDQSDIKQIIKDAGVVEIYGTPTCEVIENIDTIILNVTYESSMIAGCVGINLYSQQIYEGLKFLMKASGAKRAIIAVNKNNKEAFRILSGLNLKSNIHVVPLKISYTLNMENLLVFDILGARNQMGGTPQDVKVAVCGVNPAYEVYDAVVNGRPSMLMPVSVYGPVGNPQSILVPIGTRFKDIFEECGGCIGEPGKIIVNGLYTGIAQYTDEVPVVKQTAGILIQSPSEIRSIQPVPCIHCARCVDVCPVDILPTRVAILADKGKFDECRMMHVMNCVECGLCTVECPSKIPLLQLIKYAKVAIEKAYADVAEKESSNLTLGCESCEGGI
ncbi:MAG: RnfABCDGE type electron transport complex subunit C [Methanosarcinaceae archaeon]